MRAPPSPKPNYLPKVPPLNLVTLGVGLSAYELERDTFNPMQSPNGIVL
jgi:hypothetical protein